MKSNSLIKTILLALGLFQAMGIPCHAQEEPEKKSAMVRFTVWGDWQGKDLYIKGPDSSSGADGGFIKIDLLDLGYSSGMPYQRTKPIELCTPVEKEEETIWQPLITVAIPADIREPLVMIFPKKDGEASHRVFDLNPSVFPYGGYQLVNLTEVRLFAKLDETGLMLGPGESGQFKGNGDSRLNVWLRVAAEGLDKNSYVIYSSMMRNRSDKRMFMFFHRSDSSPDTPVAVRTLVDYAPQKTTP